MVDTNGECEFVIQDQDDGYWLVRGNCFLPLRGRYS